MTKRQQRGTQDDNRKVKSKASVGASNLYDLHFDNFTHGSEDGAAWAVRPTVESIIFSWENSGCGSIGKVQEIVAAEDTNLLSDVVHRRVVVAVWTEKYLALADHLKIAINLSYQRLKEGRLVQKVSYEGQTILLLTMLPTASSVGTVYDEAALSEAFADAGEVGRVTVDHYELKLACRLIDKFGKAE